jgi:hypothetical protein
MLRLLINVTKSEAGGIFFDFRCARSSWSYAQMHFVVDNAFRRWLNILRHGQNTPQCDLRLRRFENGEAFADYARGRECSHEIEILKRELPSSKHFKQIDYGTGHSCSGSR